MEALLGLLPIGLGILGVIVIVAIVMKSMYKTVDTNRAMVIVGPGGNKIVTGKGTFIIPFLQTVKYMTLESIQSDFISKTDIPTKDVINVIVDVVCNVSISKKAELMEIAATKFLGWTPGAIREFITPVLEGNTREIVSGFTLKELIQGDKEALIGQIVANVTPDLEKWGLELDSFNIQSFKDRNGIIDNLGIENIAAIEKDAKKAKYDAEKEMAIAQAEAKKEANDAQVAADLQIANTIAEANKKKALVKVEADREAKEAEIKAQTILAEKDNELAMRRAELKKEVDTKQAEADAAYEIQKEEQRKTIEAATADANLVRQEKEIELKEREVAIKEKTLEAEIKKRAEAEKYARQQKADAELYETQRQAEADLFDRQKKAEADKFEAELQAQSEIAKSEAQKVAMENEAAGIEAKGLAEAKAIEAKALAEAEGILKKAEAMKQMDEAAKLEMYLNAMPKIAAAVAEPLSKVGNITMYGDGNTTKMTQDITTIVSQVEGAIKDSTGLDIKSMLAGMAGHKLLSGSNE